MLYQLEAGRIPAEFSLQEAAVVGPMAAVDVFSTAFPRSLRQPKTPPKHLSDTKTVEEYGNLQRCIRKKNNGSETKQISNYYWI